MKSSGCKSNLVWPSIVTFEDVRAEEGTLIFISTWAGKMIGLKDNEWGAIGVTQIT
jgi:hypothetical protein